MQATDPRWASTDIYISKDSDAPDRFRVEFRPLRPSRRSARNRVPRTPPKEAYVIVEDNEELRVKRYFPSDDPAPGLFQQDYEAKALQTVREYLDLLGRRM